MSENKITEFPSHLYRPSQAESLNAQRTCLITPQGTSEQILMTLTAGQGEFLRITHYALFTDAQYAEDVQFIPRINGRRILRLHGTPQSDGQFILRAGLGPDIGNNSLISCDIYLKPNQTLTWHVINSATVDTPMSVRMVGYEDSMNARKSGRFR